jgi:predicted metal-binding transcription factor (methanogenesis marker protein 9)
VCGVQFGYDDAIDETGWTKEDWASRAKEEISRRHDKLREIWQAAGSLNWWDESTKPDFVHGVPWFDKYWDEHPDEHDEWQRNLSSYLMERSAAGTVRQRGKREGHR